MEVLVTDFSGVYAAEGFMNWLVSREGESAVRRLDFLGLDGTQCYLDPESEERIAASLPHPLPRVRWIDSGDYHYMSHLLALRECEPFHLLLLDHHPDNQEGAFGGDMLSCGSWVLQAQERNPMLLDVQTVGPEDCPQEIPAHWLERCAGERVYLSLDKDFLSPQCSRTDWSQGNCSLEQLFRMLEPVFLRCRVVAADVCGERSESKGATSEDYEINLATNIEIQKFLTNHLK